MLIKLYYFYYEHKINYIKIFYISIFIWSLNPFIFAFANC